MNSILCGFIVFAAALVVYFFVVYWFDKRLSICFIIYLPMTLRFVNALCYLLDWKCSISLATVWLMHADLIFLLYWKVAKVNCISQSFESTFVCFCVPILANIKEDTQHDVLIWLGPVLCWYKANYLPTSFSLMITEQGFSFLLKFRVVEPSLFLLPNKPFFFCSPL